MSSLSNWWLTVLSILSCILLNGRTVLCIEYDENGNVVYNDYNKDYMIDDELYFEMSISQLLSWTMGSIILGIVIFGGGLIWYKQTQRLNNKI